MSLNIKLLLDTRRSKKDGSYPLVMRILYNRKSVQIPMGYSLFENEWIADKEKVKSNARLGEGIVRLNNALHKERSKAYDLFTELKDSGELASLSLVEIKERLIGTSNGKKKVTVTAFLDEVIEGLITSKKQGNAAIYKTLKNKLISFVGHSNLTFDQITFRFLTRLETQHYATGGNAGGLSVYMRTLRSLYNKAVSSGYASKERYPFNDYKIKSKKAVHKAMSEADFMKLIDYVPTSPHPSYERAKRLFLASFYLRGINWMDMAYLTMSNVQGDFERIRYVRRKTGEPFNIKIQPKLKEILVSFLPPVHDKDTYLFPIIPQEQPEEKHVMTIRNKRQRLNKLFKKIAEELDVAPFTIYTARHTYATMAKRKGIPTAVIQESLGHATETMTQTYLDSFENSVVDEYDELIMS